MDESTVIWDWGYTLEVLPVLAKATIVTIEATFVSFIIAAVLGLVLAILRMSGGIVGWVASALVELVRSTPLLIQIFFIFFVFPNFGIVLDAFTCGIIALSLHYGCYCSEVYRAGLEAVPRGQWEACIALNLNSWNTFKNIILPQAIPPIVPALGNYLVALFKDTPLLSAIAVLELVQTAKILGSENFRYTEPMTIVGIIFLLLSLISSAGIRWLERRLNARSLR
ncbi:MAG TPA: ectoine/hydroxyectoine ABC transporter permease subunit EhuD [Dongiaceae bacterium]|jgi:polar amino acid transport system permease protein|nr:ectoine/hydroxyectoine ABC transporter permease subunit EhuD [Dongiaceae bacterium]